MPGPPKTPTQLRMLRGNPGHEAIPRGEPKPRGYDKVPPPPSRLKDEARDEWLRLAPELHRLGLLTVADIAPLMLYCDAYGTWCEAQDAMTAIKADDPHHFGLLTRTERGIAANALVKIARDAAHDLLRYAQEFGFTPASRTRISGGASAEPESKFGELLAN
ncbi:phage terminase small subunit P27 family [Bradyrhizobium elkanii]|uniref:phage terminase small subunit P27 family n=1 Tax=Bradyrhizobium elkanii TaxID=29448 RepID=UPI000684874A|nr:phage terminase small subunit P27 family [Bradyrhizobium elkanii]